MRLVTLFLSKVMLSLLTVLLFAAACARGQSVASPNAADKYNYVRVSASAVLGPLGYVVNPSLTSATQMTTEIAGPPLVSEKWNYPSIIFYISAVPLAYVPTDADEDDVRAHLGKIKVDQETNRNPEWLDATFQLELYDSMHKRITNDACEKGEIQLLGILPQQTVSSTKTNPKADTAAAVNDVAGALVSFYPGVQGSVTAATKATNVVFQDLFPPKPVAFQYSNVTSACEFGWFFRPNKSSTAGAAGPASILGLQTGIVLFKTSPRVRSIDITGRILSRWNKRPSAKSRNRVIVTTADDFATLSLPDLGAIDYNAIASLSSFPALISRQQAKSILHINSDTDFLAFIKANKLVVTGTEGDYVTNASLTAALAAKSSASENETNPK